MDLKDIFVNIVNCLPAARGSLCAQYLTRVGADGKARKLGPYHVLTRSVGGKTVSRRVPAKDVERVRADIERGKVLEGLFESIWAVAERGCPEREAGKKKARST